jgi:hypothetical protein
MARVRKSAAMDIEKTTSYWVGSESSSARWILCEDSEMSVSFGSL